MRGNGMSDFEKIYPAQVDEKGYGKVYMVLPKGESLYIDASDDFEEAQQFAYSYSYALGKGCAVVASICRYAILDELSDIWLPMDEISSQVVYQYGPRGASVMASEQSNKDNAMVGMFWYNTKDKELFGIVKEDPSKMEFSDEGIKSTSKTHPSLWKKEYHKGNPLFRGDYTMKPRGRVRLYKDKGFAVMVGKWLEDYPEAQQMIIKEFNLPEDVAFMYDEHWDIGEGRKGDTMRT
jgi:hypothetical protein